MPQARWPILSPTSGARRCSTAWTGSTVWRGVPLGPTCGRSLLPRRFPSPKNPFRRSHGDASGGAEGLSTGPFDGFGRRRLRGPEGCPGESSKRRSSVCGTECRRSRVQVPGMRRCVRMLLDGVPGGRLAAFAGLTVGNPGVFLHAGLAARRCVVDGACAGGCGGAAGRDVRALPAVATRGAGYRHGAAGAVRNSINHSFA